jgi:hypothetical protein
MNKIISILCMALVLLIGTVPYADAIGHGGSHGGGLGHGSFHSGGFAHEAFHGGGFGHHPFIAPHRFGHIDHFRGGIFFNVPPLWVAPEPYVEVTPVPPPVPWGMATFVSSRLF